MAIPFNLPTDEETEDNYRRLDQLLVDLYSVLRQILLRSRHVPDTQMTEERTRGAPAPSGSRQVASDVTGSRRPNLPDVVSSALPLPSPPCACCQCPSRRRRHRRRRRTACCTAEHNTTMPGESTRLPFCVNPRVEEPRRVENWLVIGEQLRKIAEEFKTSFRKPEISKENEDNIKMEVKTTGLFSLLVPAHFRSSIWTTVILLVGWRLLVRAR